MIGFYVRNQQETIGLQGIHRLFEHSKADTAQAKAYVQKIEPQLLDQDQ